MRSGHDSEIRRHLDRDERLLWSGGPRTGIVLRASDTFMIPFSIMWGGFAIFWEVTAIAGGAGLFFALWGVPFVLVGLYFLFGRFVVDARARAATSYGLTDSRVIIVSGMFSRSVKSIPLRGLTNIELQEKADRTGTILLGPTHPFGSWYQGMAWPGAAQFQTPRFEMIAGAKSVHDQILEAQRAAT